MPPTPHRFAPLVAALALGVACGPGAALERSYLKVHTGAPPPPSHGLRIVTLNLWRPGPDKRARAEAAARALAALSPDVVMLQEVYADPDFNVADLLAARLGANVFYRVGIDSLGYGEGIAVLVRAPAKSNAHVTYSVRTRASRHALVVTARWFNPFDVESCAGCPPRELRAVLVTTHLDGGVGEQPRSVEQMGELARASAKVDGPAVSLLHPATVSPASNERCETSDTWLVLGGDFNVADNEPLVRCLGGDAPDGQCPFESALVDTFRAANPEAPGYTYARANPNADGDADWGGERIDYIWAGLAGCSRAESAARVRSSRVVLDAPVDGIWPSDHFGVLTVLEPPPFLYERGTVARGQERAEGR